MNANAAGATLTRPGLAWTFLIVAGLFAVGSTIQLFLAGLSTFDSGLHWNDHVLLGRTVSLFAFLLPVIGLVARLSRLFIVLSAVAAGLYVIQVMLTFVEIGPLAALHALNSLPLIILPALAALRIWEILREPRNG